MRDALKTFYPTLLQSDSKEPPTLNSGRPPSNGQPIDVIDDSTYRAIEVEKLFSSLNHAETLVGQATLHRSLKWPLADTVLLREKQSALKDIEANPILKAHLVQMVARAKSNESGFQDLLFGTFLGLLGSKASPLEFEGFGYDQYISGTRFMLNLVDDAEKAPKTSSVYLQAVLDNIGGLAGSRAYKLAKGPAYRIEKGMVTKEEKGALVPGLKFTPSLFKPVGIALFIAGFLLALEFLPFFLEIVASMSPIFWFLAMPLSLLYFPIVGNFDRDGCIYPLRNIFRTSSEVQQALDGLGQIDELLSFIRFKEAFVHPMVLPNILDDQHHKMDVTLVRNPILAKDDSAYVGNSLELNKARLVLVTGPNSGGKTAFCKTLVQSQLMAQIGCYVPAEAASLTIADRMFYQVPEISQLNDGEGRFGTELRRTKAVFMAATPRSLVVMDELSEGTTHQEKIEISMSILDGFYQKGNNTLLITHNHELVEAYEAKGVGMARQVEFSNDLPTYKIVPGISHVSHADRVAKKIGFSKEDIQRHLEAQ